MMMTKLMIKGCTANLPLLAVVLAVVLLALRAPGAEAGGIVITDISSGEDHTCAVSDAGAVYCWGYNGFGQTGGEIGGPEICGGNGSSKFPCVTVPLELTELQERATRVSAEAENSCAVLESGGVACWGKNEVGQLGNGAFKGPETCPHPFRDTPCSPAPVMVQGLTDIRDVSVGNDHACALTNSGTVKCWGANNYGQLGTGSSDGPDKCGSFDCALTPVDVTGLDGPAQQVSAGGSSTCALLESGGVQCWGDGRYGKLGNGGEAASATPVDVTGLGSGVAVVQTGAFHVCVQMVEPGVKCWGSNLGGDLGVGMLRGPEICVGSYCSRTPVDVIGLAAAGAQSAVAALAEVNASSTCAILSDGDVKCWGENWAAMLGVPWDGPEQCDVGKCSTSPVSMVEPPEGAVFVANGGSQTCALTDTGGVKCWGNKFYGGLGNGESGGFNSRVHIPVQPVGLTGEVPGPKVLMGDVDCDGDIDSVDALKVLRHVASLPVAQAEPCPDIGTALAEGDGPVETMGDVDCDGDVDSVDALKVLRHVASLSVPQNEPCRDVGT